MTLGATVFNRRSEDQELEDLLVFKWFESPFATRAAVRSERRLRIAEIRFFVPSVAIHGKKPKCVPRIMTSRTISRSVTRSGVLLRDRDTPRPRLVPHRWPRSPNVFRIPSRSCAFSRRMCSATLAILAVSCSFNTDIRRPLTVHLVTYSGFHFPSLLPPVRGHRSLRPVHLFETALRRPFREGLAGSRFHEVALRRRSLLGHK